jgi:hypothetical protein
VLAQPLRAKPSHHPHSIFPLPLPICAVRSQPHIAQLCRNPTWPEGNVTLGYLSTLNTWVKRFNFLLINHVLFQIRWAAANLVLCRQCCFEQLRDLL